MLSRQLRSTIAGAIRTTAQCRAPSSLQQLSRTASSLLSHRQYQRRSYSSNSSSSSSSSFMNPWGVLGVVGAVSAAILYENNTPAAAEQKNVDWTAVRRDVAALLDAPLDYDDGSYGPLFVRLAWHAAGTWDKDKKDGGSNGGLMRFSPEADWGANKGLKLARDLLEPVVARYGASYADVWTLAGVVAVEEMGGPKINWRPGRVNLTADAKGPPDGRLPDASQGQGHVRQIFYRMGFNDQEIVALLGAHSLGRCHTDRSGYLGPWTRAPTTFSNEYFKLLLNETWTKDTWNGPVQFRNAAGDLMMTPADLALLHDPEFKKFVELYAKDEQRFFADFASAYSKLLDFSVPSN